MDEKMERTTDPGNGTREYPFLISNKEELDGIRTNLKAFYRLTQDIDLEGVDFVPIGSRFTPFTGGLDGGGHEIANLKIDSRNDYTGLFGYMDKAVVTNLVLSAVDVLSTGLYTGALAGYATGGHISGCGAQGKVQGLDRVGGLIGGGDGQITVSDSYAAGDVVYTGNYKEACSGGFMGECGEAVISRCYAACRIGSIRDGRIGSYTHGFVGRYDNTKTRVETSYYDSQYAGIVENTEYNKGKLTSALTRRAFFEDWDFESMWDVEEGIRYPHIRCTGKGGVPAQVGEINGGIGTQELPYLIRSAEGMEYIRLDLAACYKLTADIDLSGQAWIPVGSSELPFAGMLDGAGHEVRSLTMSEWEEYAGLFGYMDGAVVKNLALIDVDVVNRGNYTGAIAGCARGGSISSCSVAGKITGFRYVGGIVGCADLSIAVSDSCVTGEVLYKPEYVRDAAVGGLIGDGKAVTVRRCYTACSIRNNEQGGLDKYAYGLIGKSASTGVIVEASYYDSQLVPKSADTEYNRGRLTVAMTQRGLFVDWDFDQVWDIEEGVSYPYLRGINKKGVPAKREVITEGAGTEEEPYLVGTAEGLELIRLELSGCYKLTADIDLGGRSVEPIGKEAAPFTGRLDGKGHVIRNVKIDASMRHEGLFGYGNGAVITKLLLTDVDVSEGDCSGAVIGCMYGGMLSECGVENAKIIGKGYAGGLVGRADGGAIIRDCFAAGEISSSFEYCTGGMIGDGESVSVSRCYAVCLPGNKGRGFMCRYNTGGVTVEASYYDHQVAGIAQHTEYNHSKFTSALTRKAFFTGWDFDDVWGIEEGKSYPYLRCMRRNGIPAELMVITEGAGTEELPYVIRSAEGLDSIRLEPAGCYRLAKDIDLSGRTVEPIGGSEEPFTGKLDGAGHKIMHLKMNSGQNYTGLFGYMEDAVVRELVLSGVDLANSREYTGALAGYAVNCTVENSRADGVWSAGRYTGGIAGFFNGGHMIGCSARGDIRGTNYVGGLTGVMAGKTAVMEECLADVTIQGERYVGGLVGSINRSSRVADCCAAGQVLSTLKRNETGGLAGSGYDFTMNNCYAACVLSNNANGLVCANSEVEINNSYFDSDLSGITTPGEQARGTQEMYARDTYAGWSENIWEWNGDSYPVLKRKKMLNEDIFELTGNHRTWFAVVMKWNAIAGVREYEVEYQNEMYRVSQPFILIEDLEPDTEYQFRVLAVLSDTLRIWSDVVKIRTRKMLSVSGLCSTGKTSDTITLTWNPVEDAVRYEIVCQGKTVQTDGNTYTLRGLCKDVWYVIYVKALFADGASVTSRPVVEKIYTLDPQTPYAKEFVEKCEGQGWFMDEIERLLNLKGKCINTIASGRDLSTIYAIDLAGRGISASAPSAVKELKQLMYLFLNDNDSEGIIPGEAGLYKE